MNFADIPHPPDNGLFAGDRENADDRKWEASEIGRETAGGAGVESKGSESMRALIHLGNYSRDGDIAVLRPLKKA
jgi:hypothetical protein